jgi:hypothetical protein
MNEEFDESKWISVARNIRRYKAVINVKNLSAQQFGNKLQIVQNAIGGLTLYMGAKISYYEGETYIMVHFGEKEQMLTACDTVIEQSNEHRLRPLENKGDVEFKSKTMIIKDLPLNVKKDILRMKISSITEGESIREIKTRVTGAWVTATVTFENEDVINKLKDKWAIE